MTRLKIGVLLDRMRLARWQLEALRTLAGEAEFHVYSCANPRSERRRLRYALYYLLNLFTIRNRLTRSMPLPEDLPVAARSEFEVEHDGAWQALPTALLDRVRVDDVAVIIKFGLGLLRVPPELDVPILSYHHGDPAHFRGRPAGFYEMLEDAPVLGQVVQRLSNTLDAGDILASAETKVLPHSYHATLVEAFSRSPLILKHALANCLDGRSRRPEQIGANRRLPANGLVLRFLVKVWRQAGQRILYGLFREKLWRIATVPSDEDPTLEALAQTLADRASWRPVPVPPGYRFLADPFFHPENGLLVEALNSHSSRGEILHIDSGEASKLSNRGGHYSYPAVIRDNGRNYVVPEISDWSAAKAFALEDEQLGEAIDLKIPGRPRLLDPTPLEHEGLIYLFGNVTSEGASVLRLWFADSVHAEFREHPCSPIRISPNGGRMGGSLRRRGSRLFRFGQDDRRSYGDGLTVFEVVELNARLYREVAVRSFRFAHCCGPHTLNFGRGQATFDFYVERSSLLAGVRRWRHRRAARRSD
jgi:hypothetical protein